jgi:hypothetical protein
MYDPFAVLVHSLEPVFRLEVKRNGDYIYPAIRNLKQAIEHYDPEIKRSFLKLLGAIKKALPYIEKWQRIEFDTIRKPIDILAKRHQVPKMNWEHLLSQAEVSPKFQFSALNHSPNSDDLLVWITAKSCNPSAQLNHTELTLSLVEHREKRGFGQKLNDHLKKDPDFLLNLIMKSEKNFIKIVNTRLSLYLADQQIAKAIIKHIPSLVNKETEPYAQIEELVHKLNDILSNGRSVSTLLRNSEAKAILDNSLFFQIYQSEEYQNRELYVPINLSQESDMLRMGLSRHSESGV